MRIAFKILLTQILFLKTCFAQNPYCENIKNSLNFRIFDKNGNIHGHKYCEGEKPRFTVDGDLDSVKWYLGELSDSNKVEVSDQKEYSFTIGAADKMRFNNNIWDLSLEAHVGGCIINHTFRIHKNNIVFKNRKFFVPDTLYSNGGGAILIADLHQDDMLQFPNGKLEALSSSYNLIPIDVAGNYTLINESNSKVCDHRNITKNVLLSNKPNPNKLQVDFIGPYNVCIDDRLMYKVTDKIPSTPANKKFGLIKNYTFEEITLEPNNTIQTGGRSFYLYEINTGTLSNYITYTGLNLDCSQPKGMKAVQAELKVISSCNGQKTISAITSLGNISKLKPIYLWKKDGVLVEKTGKFNFFAKIPGIYSCDIIIDNDTIVSKNLNIENMDHPETQSLHFLKNADEAGSKLYFQAESYMAGLDTTAATYNWYIASKKHELHQATIPEQYDAPIMLQIKQGDCSTNSLIYDISKYNNSNAKIHLCSGLKYTINIAQTGFSSISNIYRNGQYYGKLLNDLPHGHTDGFSFDITEAGKYIVVNQIFPTGLNAPYTHTITQNVEVLLDTKLTYNTDILYDKCLNNKQLKFNVKFNMAPNTGNTTASLNWQIWKDSEILKSNITSADDMSIDYAGNGNYYIKPVNIARCTFETSPQYIDKANTLKISQINTPSNGCVSHQLKPNLTGAQNYYWVKDGQFFSKSQNIYNPKAGTYKLTTWQTDSTCIQNSNSLEVTQNYSQNYGLSIADSLHLCLGTSQSLSPADSLQKRLVFWEKDNDILDNSFYSPNINLTEAGKYRAIYYNIGCDQYEFSPTLQVRQALPATAKLTTSSQTIEYGCASNLNIELQGTAPWQLSLHTGEQFTIHSSPHQILVRPLSTTLYKITALNNICGAGAASGHANVQVLVLGNEHTLLANSVSISPQPVQASTTVYIKSSNATEANILVYNILGQPIRYYKLPILNRQASQTLHLHDLPAGMYSVRVQLADKLITHKLWKI
jgi:hypothetical protein